MYSKTKGTVVDDFTWAFCAWCNGYCCFHITELSSKAVFTFWLSKLIQICTFAAIFARRYACLLNSIAILSIRTSSTFNARLGVLIKSLRTIFASDRFNGPTGWITKFTGNAGFAVEMLRRTRKKSVIVCRQLIFKKRTYQFDCWVTSLYLPNVQSMLLLKKNNEGEK